METSQRSAGRRIAVFAVIIVLVVSVGAYYAVSLQQNPTLSKQSALESEISTLQQANQALQAQLSNMNSQTNTSSLTGVSLYANASASVVTIRGYKLVSQVTFFGQVASIEELQGSGFVVDYNGSSYIATNNHVVDGVSNMTVTFSDGNSYPATVKGTDPYRDLAVLGTTAPSSELHPLVVLSSPLAVSVGEPVYAIGSPFGLSGSMTVGIVSQIGRTITESTSTQTAIPDVIQFSAAINPGNSGGPLLNSKGEVIGITTAAVSSSQGLGFAIPASTLWRELPSLLATGNYTSHPDLGVASSADMTYQLAAATGANVTYGVLVQSVTSGGPAAAAGLRGGTKTVTIEGQQYTIGGDIITSINGVKVVDSDALAAYLEQNTVAGQTVQLGVLRNGASLTISLKLGAAP